MARGAETTVAYLPSKLSLPALRNAAAGCPPGRPAARRRVGQVRGAAVDPGLLHGPRPGAGRPGPCRPWLEAELEVVKPRVLVCLGSTAAHALLGPQFRVTRQRRELVDSPLAPNVIATVRPSSSLRAPDEDARRRDYAAFVADLRKVAELVSEG